MYHLEKPVIRDLNDQILGLVLYVLYPFFLRWSSVCDKAKNEVIETDKQEVVAFETTWLSCV